MLLQCNCSFLKTEIFTETCPAKTSVIQTTCNDTDLQFKTNYYLCSFQHITIYKYVLIKLRQPFLTIFFKSDYNVNDITLHITFGTV